MALKTQNQPNTFNMGRGNVSGNVAKSNEEVVHEEAEVMETLAVEEDQKGDRVNDNGGKPVFSTPNSFHSGRGTGRGHGPETAKNA